MDSIRWVCEDHPEIKEAVGHLLQIHNSDRTKFESMSHVVETYNSAVRSLLAEEAGRAAVQARLGNRPSRIMLKHIIQQVPPSGLLILLILLILILLIFSSFILSPIPFLTLCPGLQHCDQRPK
jgi:hypothetical protein